jgi:beta-glucosidase
MEYRTGNKYLQREILKRNWNFDGFVVSDWLHKRNDFHGYAKDYKQAAELAINAGSDMDMESPCIHAHLTTLVKEEK